MPPTAAGNELPPGPYSNTIDVTAGPGQNQQGIFVVPSGNELDVTDIILQNTATEPGSFMQVGVEPPGSTTPKYFFEMSLAASQDQPITLSTPLVLPSGSTFVVSVSCAGGNSTTACSGAVYYGGTVQLLG